MYWDLPSRKIQGQLQACKNPLGKKLLTTSMTNLKTILGQVITIMTCRPFLKIDIDNLATLSRNKVKMKSKFLGLMKR